MHADSSLLFLLLFPRLPLKHTGSNCQQIFLEASAERRRNEERVCQRWTGWAFFLSLSSPIHLLLSKFPNSTVFSSNNNKIVSHNRANYLSNPIPSPWIKPISSIFKKEKKGRNKFNSNGRLSRRIKASLMRSKKIASAISRLKATCHLYPEG